VSARRGGPLRALVNDFAWRDRREENVTAFLMMLVMTPNPVFDKAKL
jgi:hypothetical protein